MEESELPKSKRHLSAKDFCADTTAVRELVEFLETDTGRKLLAVLDGEHPLKQAARVKNLDPQESFREAMKEQQNPQGILGFHRGYEAVVGLLTQTLTLPISAPRPPASRKATSRMKPHKTDLP
ncbi:hypothetical protein SAMN02745166_01071 [Prosthecobacter debontii]|uniref:Uncharacterized protein n=1 Tax=Prosthecobacter debontii TaxID=48467 RepID=A0A1T4X5M5_9BACT|nr:hypothetical protein [Prosthecobacter debontii]SKA84882.1 hypothetical protein SAMN02745166_01071 [Prosthecobacter debontii]